MAAPRLLNLRRARNVTPSLSMRASAPFSTMQLDPVVATMVRRVSGFLGYASVSGLVNDAVVCYLQTQLPELELEFEVMGDDESDEREAADDLAAADLKASIRAAFAKQRRPPPLLKKPAKKTRSR